MGIQGVLEYATETLTAQIIGAATSVDQLKTLCKNADALDSRLAQEGYNTTYMKAAVCAASKQSALASNDDIRGQVREQEHFYSKTSPMARCQSRGTEPYTAFAP